MVKVAFRGKGTRGGGSASASGGSGRGGGGSASASGETKRLSASASGETKRVSASASGGSRRGRGRGGGRSEAPASGSDRTRGRGTENYIPLRDLPTVAVAKRYEAAKRDKESKRDKARGKRVASTNDTVVRPVATRATANVGDTSGTFADAPDSGGSPPARRHDLGQMVAPPIPLTRRHHLRGPVSLSQTSLLLEAFLCSTLHQQTPQVVLTRFREMMRRMMKKKTEVMKKNPKVMMG